MARINNKIWQSEEKDPSCFEKCILDVLERNHIVSAIWTEENDGCWTYVLCDKEDGDRQWNIFSFDEFWERGIFQRTCLQELIPGSDSLAQFLANIMLTDRKLDYKGELVEILIPLFIKAIPDHELAEALLAASSCKATTYF